MPSTTRLETPAPGARTLVARPRLGRPRLLIIGCGDVGLRIVARLRSRFRIYATVTRPDHAARVRAAGAVPLLLNLDLAPCAAQNASPRLLGELASRVLVLAPTTTQGPQDHRSRRLLGLLGAGPRAQATGQHSRGQLVYISTTGVYGNRQGAWTDETTSAQPRNERAQRRLDAEQRLRASTWRAAVLRVPGIYAPDRLPLERLRQGIPVPLPDQDVYTNHIHAQDLARACILALFRARPTRVYNVVDDTQLRLGEYLDLVAGHAGLPRAPRAPWEQMRAAAGAQRMSFLEESRRLRNTRMKRELRLRLQYPDVAAGLAGAADQASKSPSTER